MGHVACVEEVRNVYEILVGMLEWKTGGKYCMRMWTGFI
jgi:hypothetical protein